MSQRAISKQDHSVNRPRKDGIGVALACAAVAACLSIWPLPAGAASCKAPPAPGVDWQACDKDVLMLGGSDLSGANLVNTDFSSTDLSNSNLAGANLEKATL